MKIERGILQRDLDRLWIAHGGIIEQVARSGEHRYLDPATKQRSGPYNRRRKDAPVRLLTFVRRTLARGKTL